MRARGAARRAWAGLVFAGRARRGYATLACVSLAAALLVASVSAATAQTRAQTLAKTPAPSARYPLIPAGVCEPCHPAQYRAWVGSTHARSRGAAVLAWMKKASIETHGARVNEWCLSCHAPDYAYAGRPPAGLALGALPKGVPDGVQCDFCHTAIGPVGANSSGWSRIDVQLGGPKTGQFRDAVSPAHRTAYSTYLARSSFCGACHDESHSGRIGGPGATYTEWTASSFAKQGITCQDCHMPKGRAQAAKGGPMREGVRAHAFAGGNVRAGGAALAQARLRKLAGRVVDTTVEERAMLRRAARVEVTAGRDRGRRGDPLSVEAKVTNIGAGHAIPTGVPELRRMWLELRLLDQAGRVVAAKDEVFTTVYEDASGRHDGTVASWNAAKVYSDTRIGPGLTAEVPLELAIPTTMSGDALTVRATLKYRSLPDGWAKAHGLKGADATNPVTVMAEATPTVVKIDTSLFDRLAAAALGAQATSYALRALFLLLLIAAYAWLATLWFRTRRGRRPEALGPGGHREVEDPAQPEEPPVGYTPSSDKARARAPKKPERKGRDET